MSLFNFFKKQTADVSEAKDNNVIDTLVIDLENNETIQSNTNHLNHDAYVMFGIICRRITKVSSKVDNNDGTFTAYTSLRSNKDLTYKMIVPKDYWDYFDVPVSNNHIEKTTTNPYVLDFKFYNKDADEVVDKKKLTIKSTHNITLTEQDFVECKNGVKTNGVCCKMKIDGTQSGLPHNKFYMKSKNRLNDEDWFSTAFKAVMILLPESRRCKGSSVKINSMAGLHDECAKYNIKLTRTKRNVRSMIFKVVIFD